MKWKGPMVSPMLCIMMLQLMNTCSLTALQKAQKAEEASATTEKRSTPEKNINLQIAQ